jgi:hypothetical protein
MQVTEDPDPQEHQAPQEEGGEEKSDREEGGPTSPAEEPEEDVSGGAKGTRESPFEPEDGA